MTPFLLMIRFALILHEFLPQWKVALAALCTMVAGVMATVTQGEPQWENMTWKGILLFAIVGLWKTWQDDRKAHKADIVALRDKHEEFMRTVIAENTRSNQAVVTASAEQLTYFRTITQKVVDDHITKHGRSGQ